MTARKRRTRATAARAPRRLALPLVQADSWLREFHEKSVAEGWVLDKFVHVRINRTTLMARVTVTWRNVMVEGRITSLISHEVTIDLRKYAR